METEKEHGSPFFREDTGYPTGHFPHREGHQEIPGATKGWAYAVFDSDPAADTFKPDATGVVNCGFACHTKVAAKDYIFTAYGKR